MAASLEIVCRACGRDTLVRRESVYEGLRKTGEKFLCASCGHVYAGESDVPFKVARRPSVFGEDDRPRKVDVFGSEERGHTCRHCRNYLVNPFTQRCGIHFKVVQATDSCDDFEPRGGGDK
jgi:predicted RNA-binding Zn-ribbon protein involved in translation (DUF1610 family)